VCRVQIYGKNLNFYINCCCLVMKTFFSNRKGNWVQILLLTSNKKYFLVVFVFVVYINLKTIFFILIFLRTGNSGYQQNQIWGQHGYLPLVQSKFFVFTALDSPFCSNFVEVSFSLVLLLTNLWAFDIIITPERSHHLGRMWMMLEEAWK